MDQAPHILYFSTRWRSGMIHGEAALKPVEKVVTTH